MQKHSNEQLIDVKAKQLDELQTKTAEVIAEEIANQQATDENIDNLIREKTQQIKQDIQIEGGHSNEVINNLRNYLENDIPMLYETLKQGIQERE